MPPNYFSQKWNLSNKIGNRLLDRPQLAPRLSTYNFKNLYMYFKMLSRMMLLFRTGPLVFCFWRNKLPTPKIWKSCTKFANFHLNKKQIYKILSTLALPQTHQLPDRGFLSRSGAVITLVFHKFLRSYTHTHTFYCLSQEHQFDDSPLETVVLNDGFVLFPVAHFSSIFY